MLRALLVTFALLLAGCEARPSSEDVNLETSAENAAIENTATGTTSNETYPEPSPSEASSSEMSAGSSESGPSYSPASDVIPGVGSFLYSSDMDVDEWYVVEFVAGPDETAVTSESDNLPKSPPKPIYVSGVMRVNLLPDRAFEIEPKVLALQNTGSDKTASWQWDVMPKTDGQHRLTARIEVLRPIGQGKYEVLDQYTRRVDVRVKVGTWKAFLNALQNASSLGDAFATLFRSWEKTLLSLAALILAGYAVRRALRRRK